LLWAGNFVSVKSNLEFLDFSCERAREKSTPPPALQRMVVEKNVNHDRTTTSLERAWTGPPDLNSQFHTLSDAT